MELDKKKTAIITGSGRGIGKETALLLAKRGINVVICSRTQSEIYSVIDEFKSIPKDNANILDIICDVSKSSEVYSLIKATIERFGGIDILVNNAGIVFVKELVDTSEQYLVPDPRR